MSLYSAQDKPASSNDRSQENNALAQAISGKLYGDSAMESFAKGGSAALQTTLDRNAQDMNANLAGKGHIPADEKVADLSKANSTDRSAPIAAMMAPDNDRLNKAMDNALSNVEDSKAA